MFFHCIIFTKQGQSHRPTGRGAGSRAAPRKPLIPLTDSVLRTLGRGPWARDRDRRRAGGSARTWAGIERQGIERQGIGPGDRAPGDRAPASSTGIEHRHRAPGDRAPASSARASTAADLGGRFAGQPTSLGGRLYRAVAHGPGDRAVGFRVQGPERWGRDSLKMSPGPGQRKGPPELPLAGQ